MIIPNPMIYLTYIAKMVGVTATLLCTTPVFANEHVSASSTASITIRKLSIVRATATRDLLTTDSDDSNEFMDNDLTLTFCLNTDVDKHQLKFDKKILLTGQRTGYSVRAPIYTEAPATHKGARCEGFTWLVSTDMSVLKASEGDFYTGSLNILIVAE